MKTTWLWQGLACGTAACALMLGGCKAESSPGGVAEFITHAPEASTEPPELAAAGPLSLDSVTVDGGVSDAGPNCASGGDPSSGVDGGATCMGTLGQSTFRNAICSCGAISASGTLTTDGFDSTKGAPDGGAGGSVASDKSESYSSTVRVGGDLATASGIQSSGTGTVRGNLTLGGTLSTSGAFTVSGNATVVSSLPKNVTVLGTTTKVGSVAAPCDCTNLIPVASIVAAHRGSANDNATIGLSASVASGNNPARIDLPCGNYYLSQISSSNPLTIAAHGHTALYIDGNVNASGALTFSVDATATIDLFVAGTVNTSGALVMGSTSSPAHCRAYVAGSALNMSGSTTLGCNVYAPTAAFNQSGGTSVYGALFVGSYSASGNATVHYDVAIQGASGECCSAAKCDDGNPCTVDACNGDGTCSHSLATNGTACTSTNKCEQTYTCQAGACVGSNPVTCTASDPCHTAGTCNPSTGACSNPVATNGTACSDGNACTQSDSCQNGTCTGANPVTCTASDSCHIAGTCNATTGACSNPVATNGTACSDGNACTQSDTCQNGTCTGSSPVTCTASDQCHAAGVCDPGTGACSNPVAANGTSCSDGNACTRTDTCQSGVCTGANPVTCAASDQCHAAGTCNPSTGACSNPVAANGTACSDGNACTQGDSCQNGACTWVNPVTCAASDQCHTAGTCNPATGACSTPVAANGTSCSDGNACTQSDSCQNGTCTGSNPVTCTASDQCHTAGTCDPASGTCSNPSAANGTSCSDGNACTQSDSCQNGTCTGANPVTCAASDQCHTAGACNPSTGACSNPVAANGTSCSDGNACTQSDSCQNGTCTGSNPVACAASDQCHTAGTCDPASGTCSNPAAANGTSCSDGNACTQSDSCQNGTCTGSNPVTCAASDQCHTAGTCNPASGTCSNPAAANGTSCSDGNACTQTDSCQNGTCTGSNPVTCTASDQCHAAGTCDPASGTCSNPAAANGTSCSDGNACTQSDSCQNGTCTGSNPVTCTASDQCHAAGTCDPASGACSNPAAANGTSCSDGNACTQSDSCQNGTCAGSNPVTCTASDQCHAAGTCDPASGTCSNPAAANGTSCSDGNACTQSDSCQNGTCTGSNPVTCTASDQCHAAGTCDPASGACSNPAAANGTSCNDGNACTQSDSCQNGTCTGSNPVTCTASDQCHTAGTCDPASGTCSNPSVSNGTACSDGNACTQGDSCQSGTCVSGSSVTCTASDPCHAAGTCNPGTGQCSSPVVADGTACAGTSLCNQSYACTAGACVGVNPVVCTATDFCHAPGTCNPTTGVCSAQTPSPCTIPPDPATVAPPLDRTVVTTVYDQTKFLYAGATPIQIGVTPGAIDPLRVCEVHGDVMLDGGTPLSGVAVTVVAHPELGQTVSRADGRFDIVVNGGGALTIDYVKAGYLPSQRTVTCGWQQFATAPTVILVAPDPKVTTLTPGAATYQVALGSVVTDSDGTRQGVIVLPPGTTATATLPCGATQNLGSLSLRVTEYTVGANGDQRMPGDLPPASAYTYAFEVNADEAVAAGATGIQLSQPAIYYVDNFLKFPAGTPVPAGSYARAPGSPGSCPSGSCSGWIPAQTGVVINVLSVTGGTAGIDSNGDGVVDSTTVLSAAGITPGELQTIGQLYQPGKSIWRAPLAHFSGWDLNVGWGPPPDAVYPNAPAAVADVRVSADCKHDFGGALVDGLSQSVTETEPVVGTPYNLVYQSDRVPAATAGRTVAIPISGATVPASLKRIDCQFTVAGSTFAKTFAPAANLVYEFQWDGKDGFGRPLQGGQAVGVHCSFVYGASYAQPSKFGWGTTATLTGNPARRELYFSGDQSVMPTPFDVTPFGLGGWNIDVHHAYDAPGRRLLLGDGRTRSVGTLPSILDTYVGGGQTPALSATTRQSAKLGAPTAIAVAPDGSLYVIDNTFSLAIYKISPSGAIAVVAGTGVQGYNGDEIPATQATINPGSGGIALARECDGGFYFNDANNYRVRYVDRNGIIHTVAGNGQSNWETDGVVARQTSFKSLQGLAVGQDGSLYVADIVGPYQSGGTIVRIDPDGIAHFFAGRTSAAPGVDTGDGVSALGAAIEPFALAVAPDGSVYEQEELQRKVQGTADIRRIGIDGRIYNVAGLGLATPAEGIPAINANLYETFGLSIGADGTVYSFGTNPNNGGVDAGLFSVTTDGTLHLIGQGGGSFGLSGSGGPALAAKMWAVQVNGVAVGPDNTIYAAQGAIVSRIAPPLPGLGSTNVAVPSEDGRELFIFDAHGRHLQTLDALTGTVRYTFGYDGGGRLASIKDVAGNVTTIEHDASENPTRIVSPYGQQTVLQTDANGMLTSIVNPAGNAASMTYASQGGQPGLLASFTDPAGNETTFSYDATGRLTGDLDPAGHLTTLSSRLAPGSVAVTETSATGASTSLTYQSTGPGQESRVTTLPSGLRATETKSPAGQVSTALPNGNVTSVVRGPDPRFGMLAPIVTGVGVATPGGLAFSETASRQVTLGSASDLLSLQSMTDTTSSFGQSFTSSYNASNRTFTLSTPAGRARTMALDTLGRLASTQVGGLTADTLAYDSHGRVASFAQGSRQRAFAYDTGGELVAVTDPLSQVTSFTRDGAGRVTAQTLPDGQIVRFAYDADGRLVSMTEPGGQVHAFTHSPTGALASYVAPSQGPTTTYTYDAGENLAGVALPGGTSIALAYDSAARTMTVTLPTSTIAFSYDPTTGRLAQASGPTGVTLTYGFDGILDRSQRWSGAVNGQVAWTYDRSLKAIGESVSGANRQPSGVSFAYDGDGLMTRAGAMSLTFNSNAQLTGTTVGSVSDTTGYDAFGAPTSYTARYGSTTLLSTILTRDALGRITSMAESVGATAHEYTYGYDARGRLTSVTADGGALGAYSYDANGNRLSSTSATGTATATYDAQDRLVSQGTRSYTYGPGGELASRTDSSTGQVTHYTYDALGNLVRVDLPDGRIIEYVVDAAGRRVGKAIDGTLRTQWLYRDGTRPVAELDGESNIVRRFVYADNRIGGDSALEVLRTRLGLARTSELTAADLATPTYVVQGAQTLRVLTDHLGSPRLVVDTSTGAVVQAVQYDAWGKPLSVTGTGIPTLGFAGGLYDADTGLVRFGARDYDPETGRWTSKEPLKTAGSFNFYAYASDDPVNGFDVEGLAKAPCPDKQAILDAICGPNAEGEVVCTVDSAQPTLEGLVAAGGAPGGSPVDPTAQPLPGVELPAMSLAGTSTAGGASLVTGGGSSPVNQPPVVSVGSSPTLSLVNPAAVTLPGTVTDDGLVQPVQVLWYTKSGPAFAVFADVTNPATTATFPLPGTYQLVLKAFDGEYATSAQLAVNVARSPVVTVAGPAFAAVGDSPTYVGTVVEWMPGDSLSYAWAALTAPAPVVFDHPATVQTAATFSAPGNYVLAFETTDTTAGLTGIATVAVTVVPANQAPVVSAGPGQTLPATTLATTLAGSATDDGQPAGSTLSYAWSLYSGPAAVALATPNQLTTAVTFAYPGTYVFELDVSDTQKVGTAQTTVSVGVPTTTSTHAPTVSLGGLSDGAVITKPTPISATISEGSWVLESRLGGRDDVSTAWTVLASGNGPVFGTTIATFDPTLLRNGLYTVRLTATTSAGVTSSTFAVAVDGRMKVGNFTLSFTDLDTAVAGLPLTILRHYDSRNKEVGDFGVGWNLAIRDVRVEKSGKIGAYWSQVLNDTGFVSEWCLEPAQAATVTVTFPGGRQYRFQAKSSPECQGLEPLTTPDIVWQSTSDPDDPTVQLVADGSTSVFTQSNEGPVTLLTDQLTIWDPRKFTLTVGDGTVYQIDQDLGVTQVTDRVHNSLTVTHDGITSSNGQQVTFTRDAKDRITRIVDPAGASMTYAYDPSGDLASYTDRAGNTTQFAYVGNHYLQDIQDPLGRHPIRADYDSDNRLVSETDAAGNTITFTHGLAANQDQTVDRLGHVTLYTYNDRGDITQKTDASGAVWNYSFDIYGNKLSETDPLGHTTSTTFNGQRLPVTQTDALGNVTTTTYNWMQEPLTVTDPLGHVTTNVYEGIGNLSSSIDAAGNVTTYAYDRQDKIRVSQTDPLGHVTGYSRDAAGNLTATTDPLGHVTSYTYDANGKKLTESVTQTPLGGSAQTLTTSYQYDAAGRLLKTTYPDGTTTSTTYTPTGKRATSTDALGRITSYAYDVLDRLVTTTRSDGTTETQTYDLENRRASSTDAAGFTTSYAYDNVGRLTQTTFADGSSTATTYDAAGRAITTTDELGHATQTVYDAAARRTSTTDPTGALTVTSYDAAGNTTATTDALGHVTHTTYDADNRATATTYADGTTESMQYDPAGRVMAKTDALGRTTTFGYDALGRLTTVTDPLGDITRYAYDELGERLSQTDANGHVTKFAYDKRGRETARTLPDGSSEAKAYDAAGQLVTRTDFLGQATTYAYDPMGRPLSRTYPDHSVVSFTYTPDGRRATAVDARGTTTYGYDNRRRMTQENYPDGRALTFAYDAHGERTGVTTKLGSTSLTTTTAYDAAGRPDQVTDPLGRAFAATYDADGNRTGLQYPNTTSTTYAYDSLNHLTHLATSQGSTPIQSYAYTLDPAGKRTQVTEGDGTHRAYAYDSIDRLTGETVTGSLSYAKTFAYDPVGNRTTQTTTGSGAASVAYAYDTRDRLTTEGTTSYAYDTNGNVTSKSGEATYAWDYENRLTSVKLPSGVSVAHAYDPDGNRVQTGLGAPVSSSPVACPGNSAYYMRQDTTTQGTWIGTYGSDGQYINAETPAPPPYASLTVTHSNSFTWATGATDVKDLQVPPTGSTRIASTWYSPSNETFHVVTTDNNAHTVAFYMLDWNSTGRSQTITVQTPDGTVIDAARPFSNFTGGVWALYRICGSVDFVVTWTGGSNAAVSGVFFGPPPGAPVPTNLLVDTSGGLSQVVAETDTSGKLSAYYVRDGDELLAVMRPGSTAGTWSTRFVHADGLGSVRVLTDESGTTVNSRAYEAFGTKNVEAGNDPLTCGFAGEPFEGTSKLAYHRARWMDARVGRFEGMDPEDHFARNLGIAHLYTYASDNPVTGTDPTGQDDLADLSVSISAFEVLGSLEELGGALAKSTAIVCSAEATASFLSPAGFVPSGFCKSRWFNHYTDFRGFMGILGSGQMKSSRGVVYVTPEYYFSGAVAKDKLALPNPNPPVMFWRIPESSLTNLVHLGPAAPTPDDNGKSQNGGGDEWTADSPVPLAGAVPVPIGP